MNKPKIPNFHVVVEPVGSIQTFAEFRFFNAANGQVDTFPKVINELNDPSTIDFEKIEVEISESLKNKTLNLNSNQKIPVTIFAFIIGVNVIAKAIVSLDGRNQDIVFTQRAYSIPGTYFVGGKILTRDEILRAFGGDIKELAKIVGGKKGIQNIVPKAIFPFNENIDNFIPREGNTSSVLMV